MVQTLAFGFCLSHLHICKGMSMYVQISRTPCVPCFSPPSFPKAHVVHANTGTGFTNLNCFRNIHIHVNKNTVRNSAIVFLIKANLLCAWCTLYNIFYFCILSYFRAYQHYFYLCKQKKGLSPPFFANYTSICSYAILSSFFSVDAGYAWQVFSLSFSRSLFHPVSVSLSLFFYSLSPRPPTFLLSVQVRVSRRKPPLLRQDKEFKETFWEIVPFAFQLRIQ